ncbi:MAG: 4-amino-4-deoxy-L-arabinose transferase [Nocardioides sp.]
MSNAEQVVELALSRPPTLGAGRLVCVDGPAGSGKTTLADEVASLVQAPEIHMDDLFEGWDGLPRITAQLDSILRPLAQGRPGRYRRWDWPADDWAETVVVPPVPLLVLEGVGSGARGHSDLVTVLAWVEVPHDLRMSRGLERGGHEVAERWARWAADEQSHFVRESTRDRVDLTFDGTRGRLVLP